MKSALVLMALVFSVNSYAHFYLSPSQISTLAPTLSSAGLTDTSSRGANKIAAETLIKDANEYRSNGTVSMKLATQISDLQISLEVSDEEAVDMLVDIANTILE